MSVSLNDLPNKVYSSGDTVTVTTGSGIEGPQGPTGATGAGGTVAYFGNFFSTETQTNAGATVASTFTLNSTVDSNGISIVDSTKITFAAGSDGTYDLQFSVQFDKTDSGTDEVDVWLSKNGNYEVWSNTTLSLVGNNAKVVAAWNFQLNDVVGGDYFELHWWSPDTSMRALAAAAGSNPTRPAVPSIIVTVAQVTYTQAGTPGATGATGPQGPAGDPGPQGDQGIAVQGTAPANTTILWADTSAAGSMVVPAGGTTGQALTKNSNNDYDTEWTTITAGIPATLIDAKGDLIVGSAADTAARLAVGATNGHVLTVDSAQGLGVKWEINNGATPIRPLAGATAIWTLPGNYGQVDRNATIVLAANTLYYFPFSVPKAFTPSQIGIHVTSTGSGSAYLWLYAIDNDMATTGAPVLDVTSAGGYNVSTLGTKSTTGLTTKIEPGNFMFVLGSTAGITVQGSGIIHPWTDPTTPGSNNAWVYRRAVSPLPTTAPNPLTSWDTYSAQTTRSVFPVFWR